MGGFGLAAYAHRLGSLAWAIKHEMESIEGYDDEATTRWIELCGARREVLAYLDLIHAGDGREHLDQRMDEIEHLLLTEK